jgi:hypothetical protein
MSPPPLLLKRAEDEKLSPEAPELPVRLSRNPPPPKATPGRNETAIAMVSVIVMNRSIIVCSFRSHSRAKALPHPCKNKFISLLTRKAHFLFSAKIGLLSILISFC